jgi:hypothetical protein
MINTEHPELLRIKQWIAEIDMLEQAHIYAECHQYAPGRCPICWRIRALEQEQIEREIACLEEELGYQLRKPQPTGEEIEAAMRRLAQADVWRCHPHGKWPRSVAELEDEPVPHFSRLLPAMLRRRLCDPPSIDQHDSDYYEALQERDTLIETVWVPAYQRFYKEACLQRWELAQFEHYSPALKEGDTHAL